MLGDLPEEDRLWRMDEHAPGGIWDGIISGAPQEKGDYYHRDDDYESEEEDWQPTLPQACGRDMHNQRRRIYRPGQGMIRPSAH